MRSFAALIAVFGVATAQEPPSIAADGTELVFNWGASKSISIQDLVDRLEACETGLRAQSKSISSINDADVDCTASNDIVVGKMALTDVLRLTISIEGCKSKAASSFSALVTGDPSGNTPSVDVFVTTSTPEAFGDGQSAGTSIEGGGYQFYYKTAGSNAVNLYIEFGGMNGAGCNGGSSYTIRVQSNQGTFVSGGGGGDSGPATPAKLHLTADGNSVDLAIAEIVNPMVESVAAGLAEANDAVASINGAVDTLTARVTANEQGITATTSAVKATREEIKAIEEAIDGMEVSKICADVGRDFEGGVVKGLPFPGSTLTFACNVGRFLDGAASLTCDGDTGKYDADAPTCEKCSDGCVACTDGGKCTKCGKDADTGAQLALIGGECTKAPCEVGESKYNHLLRIVPSVSSECLTPRLNKQALTDGKYQAYTNGRFQDSNYYHACRSNNPDYATVALKNVQEIKTVRVWRRCDCCPGQNSGIVVQVKEAKTGKWQACGRPISDDEGKCTSTEPAKEYNERDCGSVLASEVRITKDDSDFMVAMELEAYSC